MVAPYQTLLAWVHRWIERLSATSTPEHRARYHRALTWVHDLPISEARLLAYQVLAHSDWFDCTPASKTAGTLEGLPLSVVDLFNRYRRIEGLGCDLTLDRTELGPADADPQLLRIGWADEAYELCVRGDDDCLYRLPVSPARAIDAGRLPSIYHEIVLTAASLGYIAVPDEPRPPD